MPVNIKITDQETDQETVQEPEGVKIEIVEKDKIEGKLQLRSALNGDLMIMDHKDIDIVLKPKDKKIIGILSMRDLYDFANNQLQDSLKQHQEFMFGTGYGS